MGEKGAGGRAGGRWRGGGREGRKESGRAGKIERERETGAREASSYRSVLRCMPRVRVRVCTPVLSADERARAFVRLRAAWSPPRRCAAVRACTSAFLCQRAKSARSCVRACALASACVRACVRVCEGVRACARVRKRTERERENRESARVCARVRARACVRAGVPVPSGPHRVISRVEPVLDAHNLHLCVRACVRACVCACVRACVCARARMVTQSIPAIERATPRRWNYTDQDRPVGSSSLLEKGRGENPNLAMRENIGSRNA